MMCGVVATGSKFRCGCVRDGAVWLAVLRLTVDQFVVGC